VRELEQIIRRAVIMGVGDYVQPDDLRLTESKAAPSIKQDNDDSLSLSLVRSYAEKRAIYRAITEAKGNISKAAKLLDVSRPTLYSLIEKLDIDVDPEN
jgi:two-component system NtrC family response regulator